MKKLGVYWESYGTDPSGEKMKRVADGGEGSRGRAGFSAPEGRRALKLVRQATAGERRSRGHVRRGGSSVSPRADRGWIFSTLKKGIVHRPARDNGWRGSTRWRADHRIEIIGP